MNIRPLESLTREELIEHRQAALDQAESLRQQLAEANATITRREAVIRILEQDIESVGAGGVSMMGGYVDQHKRDSAELRRVCAERDEARKERGKWRDMLHAMVTQLSSQEAWNGDAPGHSHDRPGTWDDDNGALAGMPCAWCALWREARAALSKP